MGRVRTAGGRPSRILGAALTAIAITGCGGGTPGGSAPADTPTPTASSSAKTYTVEDAEAALRAVESVSAPPSLTVEPSPGPDTFSEKDYQRRIAEAEVDPVECTQLYRDQLQLELDTLRTPRASVVADDDRLIVGMRVHPDAATAQDAGELLVQRVGEACREYTVTAPVDPRRETLGYTRVTTTGFPVELPDAAEHVGAMTVESHTFNIPAPYTVRSSYVHAVVGNVQISASYGHPDHPDVPVQAERAAAERAARQAIAELTSTR